MPEAVPSSFLDLLVGYRPTAVDVAHLLGVTVERGQLVEVAQREGTEEQALGLETLVRHEGRSMDRTIEATLLPGVPA
jgi:hypothetical protein